MGRNENKMENSEIKAFLDHWVSRMNQPEFIDNDPISIPHSYEKKQDKEIAAFFAAVFAWGQRITIINKTRELLTLMDNAPHEFILGHQESDLKRFLNFKHRTFQATDTLHFLSFLQSHYSRHNSLEDAFLENGVFGNAAKALSRFHQYFFSDEWSPKRTRKHIPNPETKSTCKRMNMFLRWMVRKDDAGVDFGIWKRIPVSSLLMPLDVHVENTSRALGILTRKQRDWQAVEELTAKLRAFDPEDPVKYDFALFGLGIHQRSNIFP